MSLKIDIANQVRQTTLPQWKPLLPVFEAVMNSIQAIEGRTSHFSDTGRIVIEIIRANELFDAEQPDIKSVVVHDNGVGLDDENFDAFNTVFSSHKAAEGGKGLGRFTWLKAFEYVDIESSFKDENGSFLSRNYRFDEQYDPDNVAPPSLTDAERTGTTIRLCGLRNSYRARVPRSAESFIQKLVEHFLLVLMEPNCPSLIVSDGKDSFYVNDMFESDYRAHASHYTFDIQGHPFTLHGFRLPTSRTSKHKLVYAADKRGVTSDRLEDFMPNLSSRLEDEAGNPFFYLAVVQSPYLSKHVNLGRTDFDFSVADDADLELNLADSSELLPRADIRSEALLCIEEDLNQIISSINEAKMDRIRRYVHQEAPQYRVLLKNYDNLVNSLPPLPNRMQIEAALHRELHRRETDLKREGSRIIKEADRIDDYDEYYERFRHFLDEYNELGVSALAQYVGHRKIILEFLERAIEAADPERRRYPLEEVVHRLVYPMRSTSNDTPYNEQNLWIIDERLTYHSFIASDKQLRSLDEIETKSALRGDVVIFDEKILFADVDPEVHPINSVTTIEFKRPGRDDYSGSDNPLLQSLTLVEAIRNGTFMIRGRPISVANDSIPANIYCICDLTPTLRQALKVQDAFVTPDGQGYYGYHRGMNAYYEIIDYSKMLRDAKNRNRIFFDKLNLVNNH